MKQTKRRLSLAKDTIQHLSDARLSGVHGMMQSAPAPNTKTECTSIIYDSCSTFTDHCSRPTYC
jgi:hypothetical protein